MSPDCGAFVSYINRGGSLTTFPQEEASTAAMTDTNVRGRARTAGKPSHPVQSRGAEVNLTSSSFLLGVDERNGVRRRPALCNGGAARRRLAAGGAARAEWVRHRSALPAPAAAAGRTRPLSRLISASAHGPFVYYEIVPSPGKRARTRSVIREHSASGRVTRPDAGRPRMSLTCVICDSNRSTCSRPALVVSEVEIDTCFELKKIKCFGGRVRRGVVVVPKAPDS
ncbi:hypothetical protein EVAR_27797_1 [Eumeta japonica]|uniref:Uncharacterized protein n=1 Tax=Eumeta variegata TaxID=151549 RepID=A0A4C1VJ97_EUMVA|nr:hypothetical protein EVAR_27797_1 [Eumeta japonica]